MGECEEVTVLALRLGVHCLRPESAIWFSSRPLAVGKEASVPISELSRKPQ